MKHLVCKIDHEIVITPISIGGPIIFGILKSLKLCVDLSAVSSATAFLRIIITNTVKIYLGKSGEPRVVSQGAIQPETFCFQCPLVQIIKGGGQRLPVKKLFAAEN